jgi:hypothetical protein
MTMGRILLAVGVLAASACGGPSVETWRIPEGGRMPHAVLDDTGTLHLVYATGARSSANLFYVSRGADAPDWTTPARVNGDEFSVFAAGPIDGGQLALGPDGQLHVVWFQTDPVRIFYTRSTADGFEPQRTVTPEPEAIGGVEASPAVVTDAGDGVFVFWHAGAVEDAGRAVYLAISGDGGDSFEPPRPVSARSEGACACCSLAALHDRHGDLFVSYRGARDNIGRGQRLLTSTDAGQTFADDVIDPWELGACPVSVTTLAEGPEGVRVAWETAGQVFVAHTGRLETAVAPAGEARFRRKSPAVAINGRGDTLLAWGDAPGWRAGGTLHWQVFDADDRPRGEATGEQGTIPSGSAAAAVARRDGTFVVLY